ncbi:nucleotide reductase subunit C [Escherichia phage UPEC01]|nr:nucleotide reductase subunit C [Escherichia phage UPEC01]
MTIENELDVDAVLSEIIEDHDAFTESYEFEFSDYLVPVELGEWTQTGKYQYRQAIYFSKKHNVHVAVNETRTGSYHTDWDHTVPTVELVKLQERVVTQTIREWITL